jgi:hypothetical protein
MPQPTKLPLGTAPPQYRVFQRAPGGTAVGGVDDGTRPVSHDRGRARFYLMFGISETWTAIGVPVVLVVLGIIIAFVMGRGR